MAKRKKKKINRTAALSPAMRRAHKVLKRELTKLEKQEKKHAAELHKIKSQIGALKRI
jgi:hypothetical protein